MATPKNNIAPGAGATVRGDAVHGHRLPWLTQE